MAFSKTSILLVVSFLFSIQLIHSQHAHLSAPVQFGDINASDLQMQVYDQDSSAVAMVLADFGKAEVNQSSSDMHTRYYRHRRIKIFKEQGFEYGDISIPFYSYKKNEQFYFEKAAVYLPNGEVIKLKKKDVFIEDKNEYWSVAKFSFPKLEEGCIIEYNYYLTSDQIFELKEWYFQEEIPVRYSEYQVTFPKFLIYTYLFQGNEGMKKVKDEKDELVMTGDNGTCKILPGQFIFENAPAMEAESYLTTIDDYRARIKFQLSEVYRSSGVVDKVLNTWENLRADLEHNDFVGAHYLKKGYYNKIIETVMPLAEKYESDREKAEFFYNYISRNIKWTGVYAIGAGSDKLHETFESGSGNSAQINLMLLVLLREAGIPAQPVLTSTRSHGKMYEEYPIVDQFNHLMVVAQLEGERVWMDATDELRPMGYPDVGALNGRGWNIEKGWMNIDAPAGNSDVFLIELKLDENGAMSGKMVNVYRGYNAIPERRYYARDATGSHWNDRLQEMLPEVSVEEVAATPIDKTNVSFSDTLSFRAENAAMVAGERLYFSPVVYSGFFENPFKLEKRNYPVDFPFNIKEQHIINIELPEGYEVEELPDSEQFTLTLDGGFFRYFIEEKSPGTLNLLVYLKVDQLKFFPYEYESIKELFSLMAEKIGEQIVLKRKT